VGWCFAIHAADWEEWGDTLSPFRSGGADEIEEENCRAGLGKVEEIRVGKGPYKILSFFCSHF
jgi:hypothetical protein